jgi:hypothetical protein
MPSQNKAVTIDAPYILRLIRDRKASTLEGILRHFGLGDEGTATMDFDQNANLIYSIVLTLKDAGLITMNGDEVRPTPLIEKVQRALQISLSGLTGRRANSIQVTPIFRRTKVPGEAPSVFVLMPFTKALEPVYESHIKRVCGALGLSVGRADDFYHAEMIMNDVFTKIYHAQIIVADCTGRNPNVFYEIGIAHTVGKPVILLTQSIEDVPFDLRHIRYIVYCQSPEGLIEFDKALHRTLETEMAKLNPAQANDHVAITVDDYQLP